MKELTEDTTTPAEKTRLAAAWSRWLPVSAKKQLVESHQHAVPKAERFEFKERFAREAKWFQDEVGSSYLKRMVDDYQRFLRVHYGYVNRDYGDAQGWSYCEWYWDHHMKDRLQQRSRLEDLLFLPLPLLERVRALDKWLAEITLSKFGEVRANRGGRLEHHYLPNHWWYCLKMPPHKAALTGESATLLRPADEVGTWNEEEASWLKGATG